MRPALLPVILLIPAILAFCCGCTGGPGDAAPGATSPPAAGAITPSTDTHPLARFSLVKEDMPFTVGNEKRRNSLKPDATDPVSRYAPASIYAVTFSERSGDSATERTVTQLIYELPAANASSALSDLRSQAVQASGQKGGDAVLVMAPSVSVGNQTVAFYVRYPGSKTPAFPQSEVAFRKGDYLVILMSQAQGGDLDDLATLAGKAASFIPGGRTTEAPAPASTAGGGGGLVPVYPFRVTAVSADKVGSISFTLTTPSGSLPLGTGSTSFSVQVPSMGGTIRPAPGDTSGKNVILIADNIREFTTGDGNVTVTWGKAAGAQDDILVPGESATVTIDLARAQFTPPAKNVRQGISILVKGPSGGTQFSCGNVPEAMTAGSTYDCW
jgi:hypothetical protein